MKRENFDDIGMLIVAILFGCAYCFQAMGAEYLQPFSFNLGKYAIAFLTAIPLVLRKTKTNHKKEIIFGLIIGLVLGVFSFLQQFAATRVQSGKIGFITSMYIVEVPFINFLFFKKKINLQTILSLLFAIVGLVLLCDLTALSFNIVDLLVVLCSLLLAIQIIILERYCKDCDPFKLNFYSNILILVMSLIGVFVTHEKPTLYAYQMSLIPLLYVSIGCAIVGCSLQAFCQKTLDATTASLIMSLESVFSVIAGYMILDESLTKIELIGCVLMFIGVLLCVTAKQNKKS